MTAAGPVRDSVLDALGYAIRVIAKPSYWWAPALLTTISVLPLLALSPLPGMTSAGPFGAGGFGTPQFETQAEIDAYFQTYFQAYFQSFVPVFVATLILALVLAPFTAAATYRVATQYVNGDPPRPFGPGFIDLAWRFLLLTLASLGLTLAGGLLVIIAFAILQAIAGFGLALLLVSITWFVGVIVFIVRLAIAPVLLVSGAGPVEALRKSWQMTRGHALRVLRWWIVLAVVVAIAGGAISAVVNLAFGAVGLYVVGSIVVTALTGPFTVVEVIVLVLLARLLSRPIEPPSPPDLPAWMNAPSPPPAA
jgi:hypothetical protein